MKRKPKNRPVFAAMRVARRKFLIDSPNNSPETRPPSSGNPGMRLNSPSMPFMSARYLAMARAGRDVRKQRLQKKKDPPPRKAVAADHCNQEFGAGARQFAGDLGYAAKNEQSDAVHRHLVAKSHPRMGQLVHNDTGKKQQRRHSCHHPVFDAGATLELSRIVINGQHPSEQDSDQEPGVVQIDRYSKDASNRNRMAKHNAPRFSLEGSV